MEEISLTDSSLKMSLRTIYSPEPVHKIGEHGVKKVNVLSLIIVYRIEHSPVCLQ